MEQWELGAFLGAIAFDGHALGRPKIDRLRLVPIGDPNTATPDAPLAIYQAWAWEWRS